MSGRRPAALRHDLRLEDRLVLLEARDRDAAHDQLGVAETHRLAAPRRARISS
jgi:hypothetical protein